MRGVSIFLFVIASGAGVVAHADQYPPLEYPSTLGAPDRVCDVRTVPAPNTDIAVVLRRGEWDRPGFAIPYMLTEVWAEKRHQGTPRRLLSSDQLSDIWRKRLDRSNADTPADFPFAGGFTFAEVQWSPTSKAIWLSDASDELSFRGTVLIDLVSGRVQELRGSAEAWSPDGSMLVACNGTGLDCDHGLLLVDVATGKTTELLREARDLMHFSWSAGRLVFEGYVGTTRGWWSYDLVRGAGSLRPALAPPRLPISPPIFRTWSPPEEVGKPPSCLAPSRRGE